MYRSATEFRPDVEGLRGLAVLLVVVFHAGLGLPGGFVGVDVFFVISGYLISGLLLRELDATGNIDFARFYARRVRRLLPAAAVVLIATLAASWWLVDPLDRADVNLDAAAAALSVSNVRFAIVTGDYFSAVASPSPFLHFWSLAVEEQFYLLWPALLFGAARLAHVRTGVATLLIGIFAASLAADLVLTQQAVSWAFYSLPTRAFELAAGGLVATAELLPRRSRLAARLGGLVGCGAIVLSALWMDSSMAYPGLYALVPTLGTALILTSRPMDAVGRLLALLPMRLLGRISYSLYLWHWPLFVLAPLAVATELTLPGRLGLIGVAIGVAAVSWRFVEEPFRRGFSPVTARTRRTVVAGLTVLVAIAVTSSTLAVESSGQIASLAGDATSTTAGSASAWTALAGLRPIVSLPSPKSSKSGKATAGSTPKQKASPQPKPTSTPKPKPQPSIIALPSNVRPSLASARNDKEVLWSDGCLAYEAATAPRAGCVFGRPSGSTTVALVGDSHASALFPAVNWVARKHGAQLVPFVKVACPFIDMRIVDPIIKREYAECASWNAAVLDRLADLRPDLTIVAMSHWIYPVRAADKSASRIGAAVGRMLSKLSGRVVLLVDTPHADVDVPACLSRHVSDIRPCATPRYIANSQHGVIERIAANAADVPRVDLAPAICPANPCAAVVGGMIVWRDSHHLTATFCGGAGSGPEPGSGPIPLTSRNHGKRDTANQRVGGVRWRFGEPSFL